MAPKSEPKSPPKIKLNMPPVDSSVAGSQVSENEDVFNPILPATNRSGSKKRERSTSTQGARNLKRLRRASEAVPHIVKDHVQYFDSISSLPSVHQHQTERHASRGSEDNVSGESLALEDWFKPNNLEQKIIRALENNLASSQQQLRLAEDKAELDLSIRLTLEEIIECYFKLQDNELATIRAASREAERLLLEHRADAYKDEAHAIDTNLVPSVERQAKVVERLIQKHCEHRSAYDALRKRMQAFDEKWSGLTRVETYSKADGETPVEALLRLRGKIASYEKGSGHQTVRRGSE